jgi:hypothetical protein
MIFNVLYLEVGRRLSNPQIDLCGQKKYPTVTSGKKGFHSPPISPQPIRSAAKGSISPGSFENVGQGAFVPVQMGPSVPVSATNRD